MVFRRELVSRALKATGAIIASAAAFGGGYAFKGVQTFVDCTVTAPGAVNTMWANCTNLGNVTVFTQAAVNSTISVFECLPHLMVDTEQILACVVPIGGSYVGALAATVVGIVLSRSLLSFKPVVNAAELKEIP